jgi:hypothetical protein
VRSSMLQQRQKGVHAPAPSPAHTHPPIIVALGWSCYLRGNSAVAGTLLLPFQALISTLKPSFAHYTAPRHLPLSPLAAYGTFCRDTQGACGDADGNCFAAVAESFLCLATSSSSLPSDDDEGKVALSLPLREGGTALMVRG